MTVFLIAIALFAAGGVLALSCGKNFTACRVASAFASLGCLLGFLSTVFLLLQQQDTLITLPIKLPLGQAVLRLDPLACFFLLPVFFIGFFSALILPERMKDHEKTVHFGRQCFFFCAFLLSMCLVITAAEGFFFLMAWECMSIAPFFLLSPEDKNSSERYSSWLYLIVAHLGALPLLFLFASMMQEAGSGLFIDLASIPVWHNASLLFILALLGFGMKMGLVPLHVWMPEAHSLAPVDVTILLSGTMVNIGFYGILRIISILGAPQVWWGYTLMGVGALSGLFGIIFALGQTNLKRSLAFSSADNMGIVALGTGAAILVSTSVSTGSLAATFLLGGALLHVWNHAIFKGLLFLSGAAVVHSTGTTTISHLGGLQKKMPVTGTAMAIGAAAISGLPPLNGFISELLLYIGFAKASMISTSKEILFIWLGLFSLATIAGLSLLCFSRLYALVFLGAPRSPSYTAAQNTTGAWRFAIKSLGVFCFAASLGAPLLFMALKPVISMILTSDQTSLVMVQQNLIYASATCAGLILLILLVWKVFSNEQKKLSTRTAPTWDCGYALPSARMQYTAGSFSQFPASVLRPFMRAKVELPVITEIFPQQAQASFVSTDWMLRLWGNTVFSMVEKISDKAKIIQHGHLNAYVLYIFIALLAALAFALGGE